MEVSSHSLCLGRVAPIHFKAGIYTNLTPEHLDFHKTMEEYAAAKELLFRQSDMGIFCADDQYVKAAAEKNICKSYTVSTFEKADYTCAFYHEADLIISALSIHHLEDDEKAQLFQRIYTSLPAGGCFINYDQFCEDTKEQTEVEHQEWLHFIMNSGLSDEEIARWRERSKLDRECSVNQEISMLEQSGFSSVNLVFKCGKFAVIQAIK